MVYTPEAHIPITEVYAENGVVFMRFKKPKTQIYEVMTLDMFLSSVYQSLQRRYYGESFFTRYLISNNHPAIIDRDTFNLVQAKHSANAILRPENINCFIRMNKHIPANIF